MTITLKIQKAEFKVKDTLSLPQDGQRMISELEERFSIWLAKEAMRVYEQHVVKSKISFCEAFIDAYLKSEGNNMGVCFAFHCSKNKKITDELFEFYNSGKFNEFYANLFK